MAKIRRYNPAVWRVIYVIPAFGGAVWRKDAAENREVISKVRTGDSVKWPSGLFQSPHQ